MGEEKQFADDIINGLPGIFFVLDRNSRFIRWNRRLGEVFGVADEALAGRLPGELFVAADRERVHQALAQAFAAGEAQVEATVAARGRGPVPYGFTARRMVVDGAPYLVVLGIDIAAHVALERELAAQANTDPLTGLCTRRRFLELAEGELARTRRYGGTLSLMMLDLDRFKAINDCHGHRVGDRVLRTLGETCRTVFRNIDIVGRMGGEEFAVLLPATDTRKACEVAERLRRKIEAAAVPAEAGDPLHFTASIGVSGLADRAGDIDALLELADQALYRAKHGGRNRVASLARPRSAAH